MRWLACALLVTACSSPAEPVDAPLVLRLGTHMGLERMAPEASSSFTRNMLELVYEPLSAYFEPPRIAGRTVRLKPLPPHRAKITSLAAALRPPELESISIEGEEVVITLKSEAAATALPEREDVVDLGPYRPEESQGDKMSLLRRSQGEGPARIVVVPVASEDEEWRRLISGEFNVLPSVLSGTVKYLGQIPSLKIVPFETPQSAAIWFGLTQGPMAKPELRHALSYAVRRGPLAFSVTGSEDPAVKMAEDQVAARELFLAQGVSPDTPLRGLRLIVHAGQSDLVRAARVLQQQLAGFGVEVEIRALELPEMVKHLQEKNFDLVLFYGSWERRSWYMLRTGSDYNSFEYASSDFDAAAQSGDETLVRSILERDMPVTPLFRLYEAAVVNRDLCNVHPRISSNYTWLADIRPCRPGEEN